MDVALILTCIEDDHGIILTGAAGDPGTRPTVSSECIVFNGLGPEDNHDTFSITPVRDPKEDWQPAHGWSFCKTDWRAYDLAVRAVLCYLACPQDPSKAFRISTDGDGRDWEKGVAIVRQALPDVAARIDIPFDVMRADRWCPPYPRLYTSDYEFRFCVDGHAYIFAADRETESARFESHIAAVTWAQSHHGKLDPFNVVSENERNTMAAEQAHLLGEYLNLARREGRIYVPPSGVRPGDAYKYLYKWRPYEYNDVLDEDSDTTSNRT